MPKVSEEYLQARCAEILDAAVSCFARSGFHKATMRDIVRKSGLSAGAIYNLFSSKEEIVAAIAARRHDEERRVFLDALEQPTAVRSLEAIRDYFLGELNNPKQRMRRRVTVQLWAEGQHDPQLKKVARDTFAKPYKLLREVFLQGQRRGDFSQRIDAGGMARFLIATFHGLVLQAEWDESLVMKHQLDIFNIFLAAIAGAGPVSPDEEIA
ncbi:MAG TPA: TetR/AcrR family transcriptional regulator [Terracidiphilus sp.]|jgi:AcrR family transcriptional regulator|nr:TetR/AcrR family transcriptional regulator [Terracidiphilus sp.]